MYYLLKSNEFTIIFKMNQQTNILIAQTIFSTSKTTSPHVAKISFWENIFFLVTTVEKQRGIVGNEIQTTEHFIMENTLLLRKY